jgi:anti-sigma factor RsiW
MAERHVSGDRLSAFLDDELLDDDAIAAARHITACERCLAELGALRATRDALRELPILQAPVLIHGVEQRAHRRRQRLRRSRRVVAVAGAALAMGAALFVAGADLGQVEPTTELFITEHLARTGGGPVPVPFAGPGR